MRGSIPFIGTIYQKLKKITYLYKNNYSLIVNFQIFFFKILIVFLNKKKRMTNSIILKPFPKGMWYRRMYWISCYLAIYLQNFIHSKLYWRFLNLNLRKKKNKVYTIWKKTTNNFLVKNKVYKKWQYYFFLIQFIFFKNLKPLVKNLTKFLSNIPLKQHRRYFRVFNKFFFNIYNEVYKSKKILGYQLYFKGKLGRKGSVKKSIIRFKVGKTSYTNKNLRLNYFKYLIFTETGVVGAYLALFF